MKNILICAILAVALTNLSAVYATPDTPHRLTDVNICFESGMGIQMLITNENDVSIHNVTMDKEFQISRGNVMMSTTQSLTTIPEIEAGGSETLTMLCFGFPGYYTVTATITYETQGYTFTQNVQGHIIILGFFTLVL